MSVSHSSPFVTRSLDEDVIDPHRPVIDSHHHLFPPMDITPSSVMYGKEEELGVDPPFLVQEYAAKVAGCNVAASVVVEAGSVYRNFGPEHLRSVGETEFLNGQAAMAASGDYGDCRTAAAIISKGDLTAGNHVQEVLEAHQAAAPDRFRGVRQTAGWHEESAVFNWLYPRIEAGTYLREDFREGFRVLASMDLVFDVFILATQIDDVIDLAAHFPSTRIVVEHLAVPVGSGRFQGHVSDGFPEWRDSMRELARHQNVLMKIGGLGIFVNGFPSFMARPPHTAEELAQEWGPYVESAIEFFGVDRCMFNSDTPTTSPTASFRTILNAYKHITASLSNDEKDAIFMSTAARVYGIDLTPSDNDSRNAYAK